MAPNAELHTPNFFRGHFKRYLLRMVDKDTVATIREIKRNILVSLFAIDNRYVGRGVFTYFKLRRHRLPIGKMSQFDANNVRHR